MAAQNVEQTGDVLNDLGLRQVLEESRAVGIVGVNDSCQIMAVCPRAEQYLHRERGELLGRALDILPGPLRNLFQEALRSGKELAGKKILLPDEKGRDELFLASATTFSSEKQRNSGVVLAFHKSIPLDALEERLRKFDRLAAIGSLSAGIAHEMKNALVPVNTFFEVLAERENQEGMMPVVARELRRLESLLSRMLKYAGPAKPVLAPISLHQVLEHCLRLVEWQLRGKPIVMERSLEALHDGVSGDEAQLEQAFTNILMNALEAMLAGGRLAVMTDNVGPEFSSAGLARNASDGLVRVRIQDTGVGISPENLDRLFDTFFTTKNEGTGLGLTITRRIIQAHGGEITVSSEVNRGTTFTVLLPALRLGQRGI